MSDPVNFEKLAKEAAREAYDPRAKRCLPFFHQWSMWTIEPSPLYISSRL